MSDAGCDAMETKPIDAKRLVDTVASACASAD